MPTRVLLLRHAETATPLIFHGAESDIELSDRGQRQAEAVAAVLASRTPDCLISSGMRRALQTAEPIARACGLSVQVEPELHERRVGALSGKPTHGPGVWPETLDRWLAGETDYALAWAESYDDLCRRLLPVWERLTQQHAGQTMILVAHGMVCKVLLLELLAGYTLGDWHRIGPIANVALHELVGDEHSWQAVRINEVPEGVRGC
jgi:broad specificity phosphatase PhoE